MDAGLRAWWSHRQGLDGSLAGKSPAEILARTGWARSVGGCAPYLTLFARGGIRREAADAALAGIRMHELPGPRGCTYVAPEADFALALAAGRPFADDEMKTARKLGVTDEEIARLRRAVVRALADGPLDPAALKTRVGDAARNLGPEGVKKGVSTTLPVALGLLQSAGEIRRIPMDGRIDRQRYRYANWNMTPAGTFQDLARKYFSWMGPATAAEFQTFAGLGVKDAKTALEPLKLVALDEGRMLLPEDEEAFRRYKAPRTPSYVLVSSLDHVIRGESSLMNRGGHAIYDRGQLAGRWEYDVETASIAWVSTIPRSRALENAVSRMEAFVRDDLGDARSFSLDSPQSRKPRIEALRKAAGV